MRVNELLIEDAPKRDVTPETKIRRIFRKYREGLSFDEGGMKGMQKKLETWSMDFKFFGPARKADIADLAKGDDEMAARIRAKIASRAKSKEAGSPEQVAMLKFLKDLEENGKEFRYLGFSDISQHGVRSAIKSREEIKRADDYAPSSIPIEVRLYFDNSATEGVEVRKIKVTGAMAEREVEKVLNAVARKMGMKPFGAPAKEDTIVFTIGRKYEYTGKGISRNAKVFVTFYLGSEKHFDEEDYVVPVDRKKVEEVKAAFEEAITSYRAQIEAEGRVIIEEPVIQVTDTHEKTREWAKLTDDKGPLSKKMGQKFPILKINIRDKKDEERKEKRLAANQR